MPAAIELISTEVGSTVVMATSQPSERSVNHGSGRRSYVLGSAPAASKMKIQTFTSGSLGAPGRPKVPEPNVPVPNVPAVRPMVTSMSPSASPDSS